MYNEVMVLAVKHLCKKFIENDAFGYEKWFSWGSSNIENDEHHDSLLI